MPVVADGELWVSLQTASCVAEDEQKIQREDLQHVLQHATDVESTRTVYIIYIYRYIHQI